MSSVRTYKAMDYDLKLFGFWPIDLLVVGLAFLLVHGIGNSLFVDLIIVGPILWLAWRARKRPSRYVSLLFKFATTPAQHGVAIAREINPYRPGKVG